VQFVRWAIKAVRTLSDHGGAEVAGYVAYTMIFAIFPFLIFLTALAGFLGSEEAANRVIDMLFTNLPNDVAATLAPAVHSVLTKRHGGLLTISILITLWSASSGIEALRLSLNLAYMCKEERPFWLRRLQSLIFVIMSSLAFLLVSVLMVALPALIDLAARYLSEYVEITAALRAKLSVGGNAVGGLVIVGSQLALHYWLPQRKLGLRQLWPGVLFSSFLMGLVASLFSVYLASVGDVGSTYGGLGGAVAALLFFYVAGLLFSFGAEFNAALPRFQEVIERHDMLTTAGLQERAQALMAKAHLPGKRD
jgi:membrane protein